MNNKNTNLSIIIPTFNEKENIILLVKKLKEVLINRNYEVIIVDDNSSDGTYKKIVKEYGRDKKIVSILRKNERGLGSAILLGIKKSKYETIIGMDADFNHPPELISKMLKKIYECDLVIASRFIKGGGMKDKKRYFFTFLFNWFLKNLLGFPTMDNMSGFYAVKKEKLLELPLREIYKG
jgi:dolichol-phosphate mannosyltransferase